MKETEMISRPPRLLSPSCSAESQEKVIPLRDRILDILTKARLPLSAYDILRHVDMPSGRALAPPTIYRILARLTKEGLIARLESLNAFVRIRTNKPSRLVFCICDQCGIAQSVEDEISFRQIDKNADNLGFQIKRRIIELQGLCPDCQPCPVSSGHSVTPTLSTQVTK